jgi:hypothetical protein
VTIKRDINKLIPPKARGKKRLAPLAGNRSIAAARGLGRPGADTGIASPLTETSRGNYDEALVYSSSGLFVFRYAQPRTLSLRDGKGRGVVVNFSRQDETA